MAASSFAFASSTAFCRSAMVWAADFAPAPDAAPAWAAIGDITAGCCVPPSPVWANAVNGEMRLDPVMAAMVAAVTVRRAIPFGA